MKLERPDRALFVFAAIALATAALAPIVAMVLDSKPAPPKAPPARPAIMEVGELRS
jgi:hypothetical protein